jgi:glycosyltransferase involved in cell wall biosynthesis
MKIAILHYHLNPGGVTRIIESQVMGLFKANRNAEMIILCGSSISESDFAEIQVIEDDCMLYDESGEITTRFTDKVAMIRSFIIRHARGFILHCHNPNLGKNPALTLAIYQLARQGFSIVNHCHDFPEDRPENMQRLNDMFVQSGFSSREVLYPDLPGYHFAVLNNCDYNRVLENGVTPARVHLLQNPVSIAAGRKHEMKADIITRLGLNPEKKIITYPIRAIRRKNIGECILLAVLFEETCQFNITQAPRNPLELPSYIRWKNFCEENKIQVKFETGMIVNHEDLIRISDFCITTSIREGFGMVYLEPWLAGTPVSGRNIPCITDDLRKYKLEFPRLYDRIEVKIITGNCDFRDLETGEQENLILRLLESPREKEIILRSNLFLDSLFNDVEPELIRKNRQLIRKHFSTANYGKRLFTLYKNVSR